MNSSCSAGAAKELANRAAVVSVGLEREAAVADRVRKVIAKPVPVCAVAVAARR